MVDTVNRQVQENQYGFAPQLAPYGEDLLGQASALTDPFANPYMQYMGDRVAQFSPLQQQSYENAALMQTQPQLQDATATAGLAALGGLNTGYTYNPYAAKSFGSSGMAQSYMSPYQQNVTDVQLREAQRMADIASTGRQADQTQKGAFGGSRAAIMDSEAARNLALQKGDIQAQGLQSAYTQGMGQFNAEQGANQSAANLNAQQGQFGAGLGLKGLETAITGANTLGNLGNAQYTQNMGINQLQNQYGTQQQQQAQAGLTNQYQDFIAQQNYPYKQLGFMSDVLRGVPTSNLGTNVYSSTSAPGPSAINQLIGAGTAAYGMTKMAKGGQVRAPQGLASLVVNGIN